MGCDPEAETDPALSNMKLSAEWSIKLAALLRRIMALAATAPQEKVLVFSQFPEALRLVGFALQSEGIGFVELVGGRKVGAACVTCLRNMLTFQQGTRTSSHARPLSPIRIRTTHAFLFSLIAGCEQSGSRI